MTDPVNSMHLQQHVYRAILFDSDGTLVDSARAIHAAWGAWANERGLDPQAVSAATTGSRAEDTIRSILPHCDIEDERALVEWLDLRFATDVSPIAGSVELIAQLPPRSWAVVTSSTEAVTKARLAASGIRLPIFMVAADDVTIGKPNPEGYLRAAQLLGVPITDCVVFEDSTAGVQAAREAGATVVGVLTYLDLESLGTDVGIHSYAEVTVEMSDENLSLTFSRYSERR